MSSDAGRTRRDGTQSTRIDATAPASTPEDDGLTALGPDPAGTFADPDDTAEFVFDPPSTLLPGPGPGPIPDPVAPAHPGTSAPSTLLPGPEPTVAHEPAPRTTGTADLFATGGGEAPAVTASGVTEVDSRATPGLTALYTPSSPAKGTEKGEPDLPGTDVETSRPPSASTGAIAATQQVAATGAYEPAIPETVGVALADSPAVASARGAGDPAPAGKGGDAPAGVRCGRYILKRFHARGGMGEVWVAEDPSIGRDVALKRMLGRRPDQVHRFRVEAQVTGQLEHPGIAPVHEMGVNEAGETFYAMKFVQGRTLHQVIEAYHSARPGGDPGAREVEQSRLLKVFHSLCMTVAYAHSRGVLHRDLKPENVMLGPFGETIVLDWGIAKVLGQPEGPVADPGAGVVNVADAGPETETRVGTIMGTPSYMAPEVAAGLTGEIDQRSDVYLLGATLYEILTGRRPRKGNTAHEIIKQAQHEPPIPAAKVKPQVPRVLDAICRKAMAQRKEDRYPTALELAEDVERYMAGEPVTAYREGLAARAWRWARRHRKALGIATASTIILALVLAGIARVREAERHRVVAQREAERLRTLDRARRDVQEFRRLADEARFFAATTDPVAEHAPYFDPRKGEATALAALAIADRWGPSLGALPLPEERDALRRELYDLILQAARVESERGSDPAAARETLALLDRARPLRGPTRSENRLRALAYERLGDEKKAVDARRRADDPQVAETALDHFLLGEQLRTASASDPTEGAKGADEDGDGDGDGDGRHDWEPDPGRIAEAVDEYRKALAIQPDHYWSYFQLGRCYLGLGRFAEAVEALGACVALRPDSPWGSSVRGFALAQQERYEEAERDLDRAIRLGPDSRPARLNRGVVYWSQDKHDAALADFAAALAPPDEKHLVEAAYYRGQLYLQLGEVDKALADFDRVIDENPGFRPAYPLRARVRIALGDIDGGLADLDAYIDDGRGDDRPDWEIHARRGRLLRLLHAELPLDRRSAPAGRALADLALSELGKAVTLGGDAAQAYDDLGAMLELTGRRDTAIAAYTKGLELAPGDVKLRIKRAWAYEQAGARDRALADLAAAARSDPENAEAHSGLGYVRALNKLPAEAQLEAELALLHGSDDYLNLHNVACIYAALSQSEPSPGRAKAYQEVAIALLRRAVALWKRAGTGPDEVALMKGEPAFQSLRARPDFRQLVGDAP